MRKWMTLVALTAAMVFGTFVSAKEKGAAAGPKPVTGTVTAVAKDSADPKITNITIAGGHKKDAPAVEKVIKADDSTKVTKDDQPATLADVSNGAHVKVTVGANDKAESIAIHTAPPKKNKK